MKRWIALLLVLVLCLSVIPAAAAENRGAARKDLWKAIETIEKQAESRKGAASVELRVKAYTDSVGEIIKTIEASSAYVQGSLIRNGNFITWRTTDGTVNGYNPTKRAEMRAKVINTPVKLSGAVDSTTKGLKDVAVFQPWLGVDDNFTDYYANEAARIAGYIGGSASRYTYTNCTVDKMASALTSCGYVMLDSHGSSDYSNGDDTTTYANVSYITILNGSGITSADQSVAQGPYNQYYHAVFAGYASSNYEEVWYIDGTVLANHMTKKAPNNFFWNGICMGMATDTICEPLYKKGVAAILGYSESVTFWADQQWLTAFVDKTLQGGAVKDCVAYMKSQVGCPDPVSVYYADDFPAYPLVRSAQDAYPGHNNRNQNQTVKSTWKPTMIGVTAPTITTQPKNATIALGATHTFKVAASGTGLKYQWQYKLAGASSYKNWSGKTSASLTVTGKTDNNGCLYRCKVSNAAGTAYSSGAKLTVTGAVTAPKITTQPKSGSVNLGSTYTFKVAASGSGLKYQWQYKLAGTSSYKNWSGKTSASLTVTGKTDNNGCLYRCKVTNSAGTAYSSGATLNVTGTKPAIVTQPASGSVKIGATRTFKVAAAGSGLKYQWQYKTAGASSYKDWSGKTSASLTVTGKTDNNGCLYRCKISNSYGTAYSSAATLNVTNTKPAIVTQPVRKSTTLSKTVTFSVVAAGAGLKYQWQYSLNNGTSWTDWSGKTSASLTVTGKEGNNGCLYRCKISNSYGTVYTSSARFTVTNAKPRILIQPKSMTVALGKTDTFKVSVGGTGLSYQWQYSLNGGTTWTNWSGKTEKTLTVTGKSDNNGCLYRCIIKNSYGSVTSSGAMLFVK